MWWSDALCDECAATSEMQLEPARPTTRSSRLLTLAVHRVDDWTNCCSPCVLNTVSRSADIEVGLSPLQLKSPHAMNRSVSMTSPSYLSNISECSSSRNSAIVALEDGGL